MTVREDYAAELENRDRKRAERLPFRDLPLRDDPEALALVEQHPDGASLRQIAAMDGVSYQAICQIEYRALKKLRKLDLEHLRELIIPSQPTAWDLIEATL